MPSEKFWEGISEKNTSIDMEVIKTKLFPAILVKQQKKRRNKIFIYLIRINFVKGGVRSEKQLDPKKVFRNQLSGRVWQNTFAHGG